MAAGRAGDSLMRRSAASSEQLLSMPWKKLARLSLMGKMPRTSAHRLPRPRRRPTGLLLVIAAAILLLVGVASAVAASSIEGTWSFNGGAIGIHALPNGTFEGTVVVQTKFAECAHEVEEPIWTDITEQPDGSYWGRHQWFFANSKCQKNPELGLAAWRVFEEADGSRYLLVCLSAPGSKSQPTIPAVGAPSGDTYGCIKSESKGKLPVTEAEAKQNESKAGGPGATPKTGVAGEIERLTLPGAKQCVSVRLFKIHLLEPKYDPFKTVLVTIKHRKIATVRHGDYVVATINLKGLPPGAFTVKIVATTVLGHHLSGTRTYHTCAKTAKKSKPSKLN
jgi:hypothetical protein